MTREEEILNAATESCNKYNMPYGVPSFIAGAEWADAHPAKKQTIWKNASQTPSEKSEIVLIDTNGEWYNISYSFDEYDDAFGKGWESCVRTYNIDKWTYLDDLINL